MKKTPDKKEWRECDICPLRASVVRPETKSRELAYYCEYHASRYLDSWSDTFHNLPLNTRSY